MLSAAEYVQENETNKFYRGFEIQTAPTIPAPKPDLVLFNKNNLTTHLIDFTVQEKIKGNRKLNKSQTRARELKMLWNMDIAEISVVVDALGTIHKSLKKIGRTGDVRKNRNHPNDSTGEMLELLE